MRMADDRLPFCLSLLIVAASSDDVIFRWPAISLNAFQNVSSRLTLVLWPAMTTERLTTDDFIARSPSAIRYCREGHWPHWPTQIAMHGAARMCRARDAHCRAVVGGCRRRA